MKSLSSVKLLKLFVPCLFFAWCLSAAESRPDEPDNAAPPTADLMLGQKRGQVRDDNGLKMKLVWCPRGSFTMEQVEIVEEPVTTEDEDQVAPNTRRVEKITPVRVLLTRGYWLGKYEVRQLEWRQVMSTEPWRGNKPREGEGDDFPAIYVTWNSAMEFCRKLTEAERKSGRLLDGWEYTLPTEAQWERACRARTETQFSFGDNTLKLSEWAWFADNAMNCGEHYAHRVGQKKPNPWGLHDMHGNVAEWCRDYYAEKLPGGRDPELTDTGSNRVFRGGGWSSVAKRCRSMIRERTSPSSGSYHIGFRVALAASGKPGANDK